VLVDARRPDLREQWYTVMSCVRPSGSQNEVQGPNLAGALGSFARAFATVSGAKVWN